MKWVEAQTPGQDSRRQVYTILVPSAPKDLMHLIRGGPGSMTGVGCWRQGYCKDNLVIRRKPTYLPTVSVPSRKPRPVNFMDVALMHRCKAKIFEIHYENPRFGCKSDRHRKQTKKTNWCGKITRFWPLGFCHCSFVDSPEIWKACAALPFPFHIDHKSLTDLLHS